MTNYTGITKLSTEQAKKLGRIVYLVQELTKEANASNLAPAFGVTKQAIQKHADKNKGGSK